jgi:hypothetical protein
MKSWGSRAAEGGADRPNAALAARRIPAGPYRSLGVEPVVDQRDDDAMIDYDCHQGIFLDNPQPEPFHVHTIVRTPNGGDYGRDLLRRHLTRHHSSH